MEPKIVNVVENVTRVEKEIANLNEIVRQQDQLWKTETFRKSDLDIRVKKVNRPPRAEETNASFIIVELNTIPLENTVIVANARGVLDPSSVVVHKNVLQMNFLDSVANQLEKETDFINVRYIPDRTNDDTLWTIAGMSYEYRGCNDKHDNSECRIEWHFKPRR